MRTRGREGGRDGVIISKSVFESNRVVAAWVDGRTESWRI